MQMRTKANDHKAQVLFKKVTSYLNSKHLHYWLNSLFCYQNKGMNCYSSINVWLLDLVLWRHNSLTMHTSINVRYLNQGIIPRFRIRRTNCLAILKSFRGDWIDARTSCIFEFVGGAQLADILFVTLHFWRLDAENKRIQSCPQVPTFSCETFSIKSHVGQ